MHEAIAALLWQYVIYVLENFPKRKSHKNSLCSDILDALSFKLIPHLLAWDALKKVKNCLNKKSGTSMKFSFFSKVVGKIII